MSGQTGVSFFKINTISAVLKRSSLKLDDVLEKVKAPKYLKKKKFLILGIVVILVLVFYSVFSFSSAESSIPLFTVKKGNFLVSVTESGELRAKNSISVSTPRVRGNIKIVYLVPEGNRVNAGDTIVRFDPTEALNTLKEAESKLEIAISEKLKLEANQLSGMTRMESDLKSAELSFELSRLNLEQMKFEAEIKQQESNLNHQKNELSFKKARQDFESQKIINHSELNKVDIEVQQKKADLERAKRDLENLTLTSPAEGLVVYETNWSSGRKVAIGDNPWPGMTLISLPDLTAMESVTYINEVDVSRIKKGLKVEVKLDAFQDSIFAGTITSVASIGRTKDNNSNIKVFETGVEIAAQSEILKPGMTTGNKIIINEIPDVIYVPIESVFDKEGKKIVYVKTASGFNEQEVITGEKSENYIVIINGLEPGNEITLRDPDEKIEEGNTRQENGSSLNGQQFPVSK
jgi:HlyD family secretion protein